MSNELEYNPNNDYLLVEESAKENISAGGIIVAAGMTGQLKGTVVKAGPGLYSAHGTLIPMRIPVGSTIIFEPHSGKEIDVNGSKYKLIREGEILMHQVPANATATNESKVEKVQLNG